MGNHGSSVQVGKEASRDVELRVPFMVAKRSTHRNPNRQVYRFYFQVPARYLAQGCDVPSAALGDDIHQAHATAAILYAGFERWKLNRNQVYVDKKVAFGTFDWLAHEYLRTEHYLSRSDSTRHNYRSDLRSFAEVVFKEGKLADMRLGDVKLADLTRARVSALIDELHVLKTVDFNGTHRVVRCGGRVRDLVSTACTVWNHMSVKVELAEMESNPFEKHRIEQHEGSNAAASHDELLSVVAAADDLGLSVIGTIAACCYEFRWRPKHVVDLLRVEHYRPPERPDEILITDSKNMASVWRPLTDGDGQPLYPQLCERLDAVKGQRVEGLMFNRAQIRGGARQNPEAKLSMDWLRTHIRRVCAHAGVRTLTLTTYRHGGITEMAEARLTPHQIMSHTLHLDPRTLSRYVERTATLQQDTQVQVLKHRERRREAKARKAARPVAAIGKATTVTGSQLSWSYGKSWSVTPT